MLISSALELTVSMEKKKKCVLNDTNIFPKIKWS